MNLIGVNPRESAVPFMSDVRILTSSDIPAAMALKEAAGWNQTETDWENVMRLAPEGCFGLEYEGRLVATATAVDYHRDLAWIGMVLTHPDYRGRGFARRLMERCLVYLDSRGVAWTKLDATDMGRPLYSKLGFADECAIERWFRPPEEVEAAPDVRPFLLDDWRELDRRAFGADRSELLATLAPLGAAALPGQGYVMGRKGAKAAYLGPCVSRSPEAAPELIRWFVARYPAQPLYWDVLPDHHEAARLAREFGFAPLRHLVRMARRGPGAADPAPQHNSHVFAIAGFEYG